MSEVKTDAQWWWDHYHKLEVERDELEAELTAAEAKLELWNCNEWDDHEQTKKERDAAVARAEAAEKKLEGHMATLYYLNAQESLAKEQRDEALAKLAAIEARLVDRTAEWKLALGQRDTQRTSANRLRDALEEALDAHCPEGCHAAARAVLDETK